MSEPGVAVPAEELLVYQGDEFINFRNHTYQWVSIKLFALPADADDNQVLTLLTRHVRYRDSYAASDFQDAKTIHGPYWLSWAEYAAPLPDGCREELEQTLYPRIRGATSRYQLPDLRDVAEHDWGSTVGSITGFFEFVLIDRHASSVALVVASDD
jgi:hypothetical protein